MRLAGDDAGFSDGSLAGAGPAGCRGDPGALLRWQLERLLRAGVIQLPSWCDSHLIANLAGCLLIGVLVAHPRRQALFLWAGVGFCGSLTTFSSWMLQVTLTLRGGRLPDAMTMLLLPVVAGLLCTALGARLGARLGGRR